MRIKLPRTDNERAFTSHKVRNMCNEAGIKHQLSVPYSPQHNREVERRNRNIMDMTRSILKAKELPQFLWIEGVRHIIYILNRSPTKAVSNSTLYEVYKGRKSKMEHMKVFGCIGYVKTLAGHMKKLDDRSRKMKGKVGYGTPQSRKEKE
ncbi:hypothetical protein E3N88_11966 [Mikania micrantha]|uniref:Integrase catalytic domain-containing protein n=1 Tax=Mikania micrantha TaxID=192012 RepID=A0A5N6P5I6_9ASTR|nr:hypothetical protein E3N88_11966 [Mikania micrantha]